MEPISTNVKSMNIWRWRGAEVPVTMHSSRNTLAASARRMSAAAEAGESPHGSYRSLGRSASLEQPGIQPATLSLRNMAKSMGRSSPINQDGNNQGGDYQGGDYQDQNENQNSAQTASNSLRMGSAGVPIARRVVRHHPSFCHDCSMHISKKPPRLICSTSTIAHTALFPRVRGHHTGEIGRAHV